MLRLGELNVYIAKVFRVSAGFTCALHLGFRACRCANVFRVLGCATVFRDLGF